MESGGTISDAKGKLMIYQIVYLALTISIFYYACICAANIEF